MQRKVVALTGSHSFLGRALLRRLLDDPAVDRVIALDGAPNVQAGSRIRWCALDLVHPASVDPLADALVEADVLVHSAFVSRPQYRGGWAHELETTGTRHLLLAAGRAKVRAIVMRSTTLVYGARPTHPALIPESAPLDGHAAGSYLRDKVEAEGQLSRFATNHPECAVTVLRFAPLLGPGSDTIATAFLAQPVCPVLLGYDPVSQFIHVDDAVEAMRVATHAALPGAVNVGAPGVVSLSEAIRLAGSRRLPLPERLVRRAMGALWTLELGPLPPGLVDFLRYPIVGDLRAMGERLRFTPTMDVVASIRAFAATRGTA